MRLVFPCCIAAISSVFDLKNASPLFLSHSAMMMTHTPTRPAEIFSHATDSERERENKRKKRERCVPLCGSNRVPVHPFMWGYLLSLCAWKNTCTHQYSHWFPKGDACFCTSKSIWHVFEQLLSDLQPFIYIHPTHLISIKIKWNEKL